MDELCSVGGCESWLMDELCSIGGCFGSDINRDLGWSSSNDHADRLGWLQKQVSVLCDYASPQPTVTNSIYQLVC